MKAVAWKECQISGHMSQKDSAPLSVDVKEHFTSATVSERRSKAVRGDCIWRWRVMSSDGLMSVSLTHLPGLESSLVMRGLN